MRNIILILVILFGCEIVQAQPVSDVQAVYEMFEAQGMREQMNKIMLVMLQNQLTAVPELKEYQNELIQFYVKSISYDVLKKDLARIYLKHFTVAEIREITKFYRSAVGKKMKDVSASVLLEANELSRSRMEKAIPGFLQEMRKKGKVKL